MGSTGMRVGLHSWLHHLSSHLVLGSPLYFCYPTHYYGSQQPLPKDWCWDNWVGPPLPVWEFGQLLLFLALHPCLHPCSCLGLLGVLVLPLPYPTSIRATISWAICCFSTVPFRGLVVTVTLVFMQPQVSSFSLLAFEQLPLTVGMVQQGYYTSTG